VHTRQLPADTLAALQSFYTDRDTRQKHFEDLKAQAENEADDREWSMDAWTEDWQISQFWVPIFMSLRGFEH
jgi:hypothetical protein